MGAESAPSGTRSSRWCRDELGTGLLSGPTCLTELLSGPRADLGEPTHRDGAAMNGAQTCSPVHRPAEGPRADFGNPLIAMMPR